MYLFSIFTSNRHLFYVGDKHIKQGIAEFVLRGSSPYFAWMAKLMVEKTGSQSV